MHTKKIAFLLLPLWILIFYIYLMWLLGIGLTVALVLGLTVLLTAQGALSTYGMLYSFLEEGRLLTLKPKLADNKSKQSFSLIVPARNEPQVLGDTLKAMAKINYPDNLWEVLIMLRADDYLTLKVAQHALASIDKINFRIITIDGDANTKSYSLNIGAHYAQYENVGVFDAEDEPHSDILTHVASALDNDREVSIVQCGVQLINVASTWFSTINCLEYYFWFKSVLPMLSEIKASFLGGNSVFVKKTALLEVGKWDESCLTEDADIGIRLSNHGYKSIILYEEKLATLEEAPLDEASFIRQRSRWDFGYIQILTKGNWINFKDFKQQLLSFYVLFQPLFRHISFIGMILLPLTLHYINVPISLALFSFLPSYFLVMQLGLYIIGLKDLKRYFHMKFSTMLYLKTLIAFLPYQGLLVIASGRALVRLMMGKYDWEKTVHSNEHRLNYLGVKI